MLKLERKAVGSFQSNCYLLADPSSKTGVLIDAGAEARKLLDWIAGVQITHILITHGHPDHVGALDDIRQALNCPVGMHPFEGEAFNLGFDLSLESGTKIPVGAYSLEVHEIPGHTQGSIALALWDDTFKRAIVGDAIFPGGPGHTQSHAALRQSLDSLEHTVFTWPDEVELYPGHGDATTVGAERKAFFTFRAQPLSPEVFGDVAWR